MWSTLVFDNCYSERANMYRERSIMMLPGQGVKQPNLLLKLALSKARLSGLTLKHFCLCLLRYFNRASLDPISSGSRHSRAVGALVFVSIDVSVRRAVHPSLLHSKLGVRVASDESDNNKPFLFPCRHCQIVHGVSLHI